MGSSGSFLRSSPVQLGLLAAGHLLVAVVAGSEVLFLAGTICLVGSVIAREIRGLR